MCRDGQSRARHSGTQERGKGREHVEERRRTTGRPWRQGKTGKDQRTPRSRTCSRRAFAATRSRGSGDPTRRSCSTSCPRRVRPVRRRRSRPRPGSGSRGSGGPHRRTSSTSCLSHRHRRRSRCLLPHRGTRAPCGRPCRTCSTPRRRCARRRRRHRGALRCCWGSRGKCVPQAGTCSRSSASPRPCSRARHDPQGHSYSR
ncbi:hypothetical protein B0H15DRAFT_807964 [Mycena belliarum]|uniref:Uncharacterized protein n=1 Tax=Mycena belliarum TaxID=1033014 RepID=A0AAD6UMF6_9AGAR|nr:hypothetical protein B0H15DRAFT_807964 [Mycena belliae]